MAVMVVADINGGTVEQYDAVSRAVGFGEPDFEPPAGLIWHVAGVSDDGVLIVDLWESAEDFHQFMGGAQRAIQEAAVPPFEPRILPVHNTRRGRGTQAGVIVFIEAPGFGPGQYDGVTAHMPSHAGESNHPALTHAAGVTDDGMLFVDVWESPEAFGRFADSELGPAAEAAGEDLGGLEPRIVPVHNRMEGTG